MVADADHVARGIELLDAVFEFVERDVERVRQAADREFAVGAHVDEEEVVATREACGEFERADQLMLTRDGSRNLAFGEGVHFCLGMPLARLEARTGMSELIAMMPEFESAGMPRRYPSHVIRGYESIPVRLAG